MKRVRIAALLWLSFDATVAAQEPIPLTVAAGKSILVESAADIDRVAVGLGEFAEAVAIGPRELLINGRTPGETSLILWQSGGSKVLYDLTVQPGAYTVRSRTAVVEREIARELPGQDVEVSFEGDTVFLRGRVKDLVSADRAAAIASTLGKTVNLLYVDMQPAEPQILLRVQFATLDRTASTELGMNLVSSGATNTPGSVSTQQFSPPGLVPGQNGEPPSAMLSDALNIFLFRPDLNLLATIRALQRRALFEILAEPNVLAMNGKPASFLAGGEFPYPTLSGGSGGAQATVTVQFREFGVRLNFLPIITPRGTIRLQVAPEVSALDFTSGLTLQGFSIPALTTRKVNTEIELADGQSFAIGGLIDNRLTETILKIPVLADLPLFGKLFQSKSRLKNNTELLVIVTPELVRPIPAGKPAPGIPFPVPLDERIDPDMRPTPPDPAVPAAIPIEILRPARNADKEPVLPAEPPPAK